MQAADNCRLISVVFLSYNCADFVAEGLRSVLAQKFRPLEIIVSDDCSTDNTFEIARAVYAGHGSAHTVIFRRNDSNQGVAGHLSTCMKFVSGEIIVVAHSDDVSVPHRVERIVRHFSETKGESALAFSDWIELDACDNVGRTHTAEIKPIDWRGGRVPGTPPGAVMAFRKNLFDLFGGIRQEVQSSEDDVLLFRGWLVGTVTRIPEPLVLKRFHGRNVSASQGRRDLHWYRRKCRRMLALWQQRKDDLLLWYQRKPELVGTTHRVLSCIEKNIQKYEAYLNLLMGDKTKLIPSLSQIVQSGGNPIRTLKFCWLGYMQGSGRG